MIIRLIVLALLASVVWRSIVAERVVVPGLALWPPVLTYLALAGASVALSPYRHQSLQWLAVLCTYGALLYLVAISLRSWDDIVRLLVAACSIGVIEAIWALGEAVWHHTSRPHGSFFNPNFLAGYLGAVAAILLGYLCYAGETRLRRRRALRSPPWVGAVLSFGLLVAAIAATGSRGGVLAFVVGSLVVLGMRLGRKSLVLAGAILVLAVLIPNPVRDRIYAEHVANPVSYARLQIWQSAFIAMIEHPLGAGLGLYQYISPQYMFPVEGQIARYGRVATTAHNEYLQMGVELGLASVVVFVWGIVLVGREAVRVLDQRLSRRQRGIVVGVSAAVAGVLAHAAVDSNLHEPAVAILLTVWVGTIFSIRNGVRTLLPSYRLAYAKAWAGVAVVVLTWLTVGAIKMGVAWIAFEAGGQAAARLALPEALADYRTAIAMDPGKALYHSAAAAAHFHSFERTGDRDAATRSIRELETAIALNPLDGRLPGLLGSVYAAWSMSHDSLTLRVDALRRAVGAYRTAAMLEPFNPWHRMELGRLHMILAETAEAELALGEALSLEPNFLPGRALLAQLYLDSSREAEAKRQYDEIVRRQERYAQAPKDPVEQQFLKVDLGALRSQLRLTEQGDTTRREMSGV